MSPNDKPLVWLHGEVKTPPFTKEARLEAGLLLRRLQKGEKIALPHSRPMPGIGARCHELRINDEDSIGGSCIEQTPMQLLFWKYLRKNQPKRQNVFWMCVS